MYLDIHTHNPHTSSSIQSVVSLYEDFGRAHELPMCSAGLHPWYLDDIETQWQQLQQVATLPSVLAIGECGLDKVTRTYWQLQVDAFTRQILLAQQLRKPVIIHCVRAYQEALQMLQEHKTDVPVIFHGFGKSQQLAQQVLGAGYYLSFGASLLREGYDADTFRSIPPDRFFLESDQSTQDIRHIYAAAAEIRQTTEEALILQLQQNFKTVFNR